MSSYTPIIVDVNNTPYGNRIVVGLATLALGTVDVAFPALTANTFLFVGAQNGLLNLGAIGVSSRVLGVGFTVLSTNALDTRGVAWMAIEP